MDFNEYVKNRGYKSGDFIPKTVANQLHSSWLREGGGQGGGQGEAKTTSKQPSPENEAVKAARIQAAMSEFNVNAQRAAESGTAIDENVAKSIAGLINVGDIDEARKIQENIFGEKAQAKTKSELVDEAVKMQTEERTRSIATAAEQVITPIKDFTTSNVGSRIRQGVAAAFPASEAGRVAENLETIRVQSSKEEINRLRAASPTGSAGGTITEKEWPKFENRMGKLDIGMDPRDLLKNVKLTTLNQFEASRGEPQAVINRLKNGEISQETFDNYVKDYDIIREATDIPDEGILGKTTAWTKYDPELKKFYTGQDQKTQDFKQSATDRLRAKQKK